jgi:hypothetical protein
VVYGKDGAILWSTPVGNKASVKGNSGSGQVILTLDSASGTPRITVDGIEVWSG